MDKMADKEEGGARSGHASKNLPEASFEELLKQFRTSKAHIVSGLKCPDIQPPSSDPDAYGE